jgi:hypothetical protein
MAKQTTVTLIDDLDGKSAADETVSFSLDGIAYEIDLTTANATKLRATLASYVAAARKAGRSAAAPARSARKASSDGPSADTIRTWAKSVGLAVNERGRISAELHQAFAKAH